MAAFNVADNEQGIDFNTQNQQFFVGDSPVKVRRGISIEKIVMMVVILIIALVMMGKL